MDDFNIILFDGFETLDALGPAEIFGRTELYDPKYFSLSGGPVTSTQNTTVVTESFDRIVPGGILLIPGGAGTRKLIGDKNYMENLKAAAEGSAYVLTVCTGSALLSATGLLDNRRATSNKRAFGWAFSFRGEVIWVPKARWVIDGKYYTSSGVTAGMDMSLGFISDFHGREKAEEVAVIIEYLWNPDKDYDPFAI